MLRSVYDIKKNGVALRWLHTAKVYFQGRNLLLLTKNSDRRDPETSEVNTDLGTNAFTEQAFTSLPLRPEFLPRISFGF